MNIESASASIAQRARACALALSASVGAVLATASPMTHAEDADVAALRQQMQAIQQQIDAIEARRAGTSAPAAATPRGPTPSFQAGPLTVTLGGYVELMVVNRSKNEADDWASNFNTAIPFKNSENYYLSEFHLTERQSRFAALVQTPQDSSAMASAYLEGDFGGASTNGNNNESHSFAPRVRHFWADYERKDQGWYLLFGQAWSLITQNRHGIIPRDELIPSTIDGQYVPGFDWLRVPQIRFVKNFGDMAALGVSLENPAALISAGASKGAPALPVFDNTQGASNGYSGVITTDALPDVVGKLAFDPGWGHYEVYGTYRTFRDRSTVPTMQTNQTTHGGGGGASVLLPLVPKVLDFQLSFLGGKGVGRYGSAQLADVTVDPSDNSLATIKGYQALAGLLLRPSDDWLLMAYAGTERLSETAFSVTAGAKTYGYGYGSPLFSDADCDTEGGSSCSANTRAITSGTLGGWWKFYHGPIGNMQLGTTWTYIRRDIFGGIGFPDGLSTNINIVMVSFRYYPYQL